MWNNVFIKQADSLTESKYQNLLNVPNRKKVNFELIAIDKNIRWNVTTESNYSFFIEQYIWNKWIQIGEISYKDSISKNNYSFQLVNLHSRINKFRISQMDELGIVF